MKMRNIILSFFILLIFSNVKAATFQDENSNSPKPVGYISVAQPTVTLHDCNKEYFKYLEIINCILRYEPENTNYAYQGNNYHWVITDFDISINNSVRNFNDYFFYNKPAMIRGTAHFISYIKENIKCLATQHISKYDFEKNCDNNLNKLASDLKALIYDKFDKDSEGKIYDEFVNDLKGSIYDKYGNDLKGLIHDKFGNDLKGSICNKFRKYLKGLKYDKSNNDLKQSLTSSEDKTASQKLHKKAKNFFKILLDDSNIMIRGYVIKIRKDGNYTDLCQNKSLYFEIRISRNDANATHDLKIPIPNVVKLVDNISGKS
ncbi:fam-d protein [Plasmodium vinckei petteri]|uniref:Fam-d protein n=1 Tax=Plasmodium vinckei petteri TaxID=138298 RepID=A0A6V7SY05_PLAVN|nr:fam-d protein [Plasmodium vinckei petteri]